MSEFLPLQVKVHPSITELPEAAWDALVAGDPQATPFLRWRWLEALEASGSVSPATGWHPRHLALWRGNHLIAAAPAYLKDDSHGEFVFDWSWANAADRLGIAYYPKLVLAAPFTPATGRRILVAKSEDRAAREAEVVRAALELARSEGYSSVHVLFPTREEAERLEAAGFGLRHGVQYHWQNAGYRTYEDFLGRFTAKRRHQLRRERRAPAEQGLTLRTLRGAALGDVSAKSVYELYSSTVDRHLWGRRYLGEDFFARLLVHFQDRVELVQALHGDRVVAGAFNVRGEDTLYGRYWGSLQDFPFLHFNVCLYESIDESIQRGLARFEPGAGGEHKLVRGFEPQLTYSAHWIFHQPLDRAVRDFLAHERAAIAQGLPAWRAETGFKS